VASARTIGTPRVAIVWIAAYLVALQAIVAAFATVHVVAARIGANEAAFVICHGGPSEGAIASGNERRESPRVPIGFSCALCALAGASAIVPPDILFAGSKAFALIVHEAATGTGVAVRAARDGLSRAPPRPA
jgi:hypothetical protein